MSKTDKPQPRLSIAEDGRIFWQEDGTNPLPGEEVGEVMKGESLLKPRANVADLSRADEIQAALQAHIAATLETLAALEVQEEEATAAATAAATATAAEIVKAVYAAGGIVPRGEVEAHIAGLDAEMRGELRALKIRLGPILVFMPELNKPAAVKMKALLWNVYHEQALPALTPPDGVVSKALSEEELAGADPAYFRYMGYPLYGGRMVRIDMLDRVISAVYDAADKGQFKATHQMAEWLGCPIAGLYAVLTDMGHTKIYDPAEGLTEGEEAPKGTDDKPELATFRLKKGKASEGDSPAPEKKKGGSKRRSRPKVKNKDKNKARVMSAEAEKKLEDSPFAVLAQLKDKQ